MKLLIINGPNLNMLGIREKNIYGAETYDTVLEKIDIYCKSKNIEAVFYQSNHEGSLVDRIQAAYTEDIDGIVINPGAYTHTSIAILDALKAVQIPTVEIHISDVSAREPFRQLSYVSYYAFKTIMGLGTDGYVEAVKAMEEYLAKRG